MRVRELLSLILILALLIAAGLYYKRSRDAEVLCYDHWRQELEHMIAADGGDRKIQFPDGRQMRVGSGGIDLGTSVGFLQSLSRSKSAREYHLKQAAIHRQLKKRYERIMHRPWTSGD